MRRIISAREQNYLGTPANYVELNPKPIIKQINVFERNVQQIDIDDAIKLMQTKPYKIHNSTIKSYDPDALFLQYHNK